MSKSLLVMRHAKSSWKHPGLGDFERPLNNRGREAAPRMGQLLEEHKLIPQLIMSSTAARAKETTELLTAAVDYQNEIWWTEPFYLAPPMTYIEHLRELPDDYQHVMVVGHNPGMSQLVSHFAGVETEMPTAALAWLTFDLEQWADLKLSSPATLGEIWYPREL